MRKFLLLILNLILCFTLTSCMYDTKPQVDSDGMITIGDKKLYQAGFASMNTEVYVTVLDTKANADKHLKAVKKIYSDIDKLSRTYFDTVWNKNPEEETDPDKIAQYEKSDVYRLNKYKKDVVVSNKTIELLKFALKMREETNGYYNPLMGRLIRDWKLAIDFPTLYTEPSEGEQILYSGIAREADIKIEGNMVSLVSNTNDINDVLIDLGGIAKGFATEKARQYFESVNCKYYMVNAGQSNIVCGLHPLNNDYEIGISFPFEYPNKEYELSSRDGYIYVDGYKSTVKAELSIDKYYFDLESKNIYIKENGKNVIKGQVPITTVNVHNLGVCTSAPTWQKSESTGELIHHLISPMTGRPENYREQVTVIASDSGMLDAYSTAMFVMPNDELQQFITTNNIKCIIVNEGRVVFNNYEA